MGVRVSSGWELENWRLGAWPSRLGVLNASTSDYSESWFRIILTLARRAVSLWVEGTSCLLLVSGLV